MLEQVVFGFTSCDMGTKQALPPKKQKLCQGNNNLFENSKKDDHTIMLHIMFAEVGKMMTSLLLM